MLTSGRDCAQIHELYRNGRRREDPGELLLQQLARRSPDTADRLLRLLRELDVAAVPDPALDRRLAAIGPDGRPGDDDDRPARRLRPATALGRLRPGRAGRAPGREPGRPPRTSPRPGAGSTSSASMTTGHGRRFRSGPRSASWPGLPGQPSWRPSCPNSWPRSTGAKGCPTRRWPTAAWRSRSGTCRAGPSAATGSSRASSLASDGGQAPASRYVESEPDGLELAAMAPAGTRQAADPARPVRAAGAPAGRLPAQRRRPAGPLPGPADLQERAVRGPVPGGRPDQRTGRRAPDPPRARRPPGHDRIARGTVRCRRRGGTRRWRLTAGQGIPARRHQLPGLQADRDGPGAHRVPARLWWGGQRSVISRTRDLTVEDFVGDHR